MKNLAYVLLAVSATVLLLPFAASAATLNQRQMTQEQRILQGIKDHQLSSSEANALEKQEVAVSLEHTNDLQKDGSLSTYQHRQLNHQLSDLSWNIYQDRNN